MKKFSTKILSFIGWLLSLIRRIGWQGALAIISAFGLLFSGRALFNNQKYLHHLQISQSAQLMLKFVEYLGKDVNNGIIEAVESGKPILKQNGGAFSRSQLDDYLGVFESINALYEEELITCSMVYNSFSYILGKTDRNPEVQKYVKEVQREDSELFTGTQRLAAELQKKRCKKGDEIR